MAEIQIFGREQKKLCRLPEEEAFPFLQKAGSVVSLVGGGGKTTLLFFLAKQCWEHGHRTAVTTTTKIFRPRETRWLSVAETKEEVEESWRGGRCPVAGMPVVSVLEQRTGLREPCGEGAAREKLSSPPEELLRFLFSSGASVLIEADGARQLPCKVPAEHEPVLVRESGLVIGLFGLDAIGRPLREVCFRPERACALLKTEESHLLTEEDAAVILLSSEGTAKGTVPGQYQIVLNKCDTPRRKRQGERILALLEEQGHTRAVMTSFVTANG